MAKSVREKIKEITRKHLTEKDGLCFGQCLKEDRIALHPALFCISLGLGGNIGGNYGRIKIYFKR